MATRLQFSYQRRFITTTIIIFGIFSVLAGALQYEREKKYQSDRVKEQLATYTQTVSNFINIIGFDNEKVALFAKQLPDTTVRLSIIDENGHVVYDSEIQNVGTLADHSNRPEIIMAKQKGIGDDIRESASTGKSYYYHAQHANQYFIRCAIPYSISIASILQTNQMLIFYYIIFFLIVLLLIIYLSHLYSRIQDSNRQLTDEKEKIYQHLRITNEGVAIFDANKKLIISNDYFSQYIDNISSSQLSDFSQIFSLKEFETVSQYIDQNAKNNKKADNFRLQSFTINKNNKTFAIKVVIFNDADFEISINDITVSIEQEQLKKQLTQNIAHELKTPVSSIQGFMETIINNPALPVEKQRFFIERSYSQAIRLSNLVSDMTLLNKIENTSDSLKQESINMRELFQSIVDDVSLQIEEKTVSVSNMLSSQIIVHGDRSMLYSALRNLVDNSLLYAGTHFNITINCYREDETHYYFSYYDTGAGIADQHLTRIFDRFYRVDEGRSRKMGGTGLGLAIVKNAITLHKGTIIAKRCATGGLEFAFSLSK